MRRVPAAAAIVIAAILAICERGMVGDFLDELCTFPASRHDDFVDSAVHALQFMLTHGIPDVF